MFLYQQEQVVPLTEVLALYEANGWTNYSSRPTMLRQALSNSLWLLTARTAEGKLVGLCRAVGDGVSIVFIQDILVMPGYHRQGIGTQLLQKTLHHYSDVYQIQLTTDNTEKTIAFYQSNGFELLEALDCLSFIKVSL